MSSPQVISITPTVCVKSEITDMSLFVGANYYMMALTSRLVVNVIVTKSKVINKNIYKIIPEFINRGVIDEYSNVYFVAELDDVEVDFPLSLKDVKKLHWSSIIVSFSNNKITKFNT